MFQGSPFNPFFVSNCEALIYDKKPSIWIHGHMHNDFDYTLGETRIICHPKGYPFEDNSRNYKPLIIGV
jgi:hypothetical protein